MGVVHLARREGGDRVALKVLRQHIVGDEEARQRLAREVSSLSRIRSRWVAEIVDADPWASVPYVATRYVPGLSLHDHVTQEGPIEDLHLLWFAGALTEGLTSVHAAGVLHRDVKPSNVLMEGRTPILIDFGLARVADDPKLTHTGWLLGTPGYLAPEILYGDDASPASDVHSWGATVAYAGTGRPPFGRGPSMAIMDRVRRGQFDLTGLHGALHDVVAATLDPDPTRRPTLAAILAWLGPQTTRPHPVLGAPPVLLPHGATHGATHGVADPFEEAMALAACVEVDAPVTTLMDPTLVEAPRTRALPTQLAPPTWHDAAPLGPEAWSESWSQEPPPERVPAVERVRRALLELIGVLAVGVICAVAPWVSLAVVVVGTWLLRSGSIATSAAGDRRRLRGRKWYDGPQMLIHAPWHLVQSIPATIVLVLWAAGLATSAALICYAAAASIPLTLFVMGAVLAVSLWWGPGGSRVRGPLRRVVVPLSRRSGTWTGAVVVLLVLSAAGGLLVQANGPTWLPASNQPIGSPTR